MSDQFSDKDKFFMRHVNQLAAEAEQYGEVPVASVLVIDGEIIAEAQNEVERSGDPTAHAEKLVIEKSARLVGRHKLTEGIVYVNLEPCVMCAGCLVTARIREIIFGTRDVRFGGCRSIYRITDDLRLNHRLLVREGLLQDDASLQISNFFIRRRLQSQ